MESKNNDNLTKKVFVTVGTTSFDKLIQTVTSDSILQLLHGMGYSKVILQIGRGQYLPDVTKTPSVMQLDIFTVKDTIVDDVRQADLLISHAGAGSVLEILEANRPLIVVINEELMGNHQEELAKKLAEEHHLVYCNCSSLGNCLQTFNPAILKPFPHGQPIKLRQILDDLIFPEPFKT